MCLSLIGLLVGLAGWVRRTPNASLLAALPAVSSPVRDADLALDDPSSAATVPAAHAPAEMEQPAENGGSLSARDFLAKYYGNRWEELELAIQATGEDLDQPYIFVPWEDVAPEFEQVIPLDELRREAVYSSQMQWPDELTVSWVLENYPFGERTSLSDFDLPELEALTAEKNQQLAQLADEWATRIDFYLRERWQTGRYLKAPFTTMGLSQDKGFYSCSHGGYGWALTLTLTREDYPDMVALEQQATRVRDERDGLVAAFLSNR